MKKTIVMLCSMILSVYSYGQLIVDRNGNVGLQCEEHLHSPLSIGSSGKAGSTVSILSKRNNGLYIENDSNYMHNAKYGININYTSTYTYPRGIYTSVEGNGATIIKGIEGYVSGGTRNIGVLGRVPSNSGSIFSASVFGGHSSAIGSNDVGTYAGYFKGDVKVTGMMYGTLYTPTTSSMQGVTGAPTLLAVDDETESIADKFSKVQLVQFNRYEISPTLEDEPLMKSSADLDDTDEDSYKECVEEEKLPMMSYGLAADQLRDVYPELVYEDEYGRLSVNYTEMVPLLVQCINELNKKIQILEGANPRKTNERRVASTTSITDVNTEHYYLSQNDPNPFSSSTSISMNIPTSTSNAYLVIYDMTGKQLRQIEITGRGKTSVTLTSEGLTPGMYLYALIADGQVINTKRMILN